MTAEDLASAAQKLLGCRYRLHGREPRTGIDCLGVLACAMTEAGREPRLPSHYRMRAMLKPDVASRTAQSCGLVAASGSIRRGDVILTTPGPGQQHLLIAIGDGAFVHAHAGLRQVISGPLRAHWPILGHWRLDSHS